ncbi:sister chromatid cohesion PDS5-like protein, partial [Trifolium medium]|nr:sister chromatid cohesion PDS5-like protein [Trifolium medium]
MCLKNLPLAAVSERDLPAGTGSYTVIGLTQSRCRIRTPIKPVSEVKSWVVDDTALTHFESLELEMVRSQLAEDEASKDNEENEIPLGVMLKQIKSQVVSGKKVKKIKPVPAETEKVENDFAISNTVRQINLDNVGSSIDVEPCNGHEHSLSKEIPKDPEHATGRKRKTGETTPAPVTKRSRSSSAHGKPRLSTRTLNASRRVSGENSPGAKSVLDADINTDTDSDMQRITIKD